MTQMDMDKQLEARATSLGKYALMRLQHLRRFRPTEYQDLVQSGLMEGHLAEIQETCSEAIARISATTVQRLLPQEELRYEERLKAEGTALLEAEGEVVRSLVLTTPEEGVDEA